MEDGYLYLVDCGTGSTPLEARTYRFVEERVKCFEWSNIRLWLDEFGVKELAHNFGMG